MFCALCVDVFLGRTLSRKKKEKREEKGDSLATVVLYI